jgi:serralysin
MQFTVMSYRSYVGGSTSGGYTNETWGYAQSLMMLDIAAAQHLYGANFATRSGDTVYSWSPATGQGFIDGVAQAAPGGNRIFQTVWDGGGIDTYDFSNYGTALAVSLEPGAWTLASAAQRAYLGSGRYAPGNIANAWQYQGDPRSLIENAVGGAAGDQIAGNGAANTLRGEAGGDTLQGLGGDDLLVGGAGDDVLDGGEGVDAAAVGGAASAYVWTPNGDGTWTVAGADGTDRLVGIEVLRFADGTVSLADAGSAPPAIPEVTPPVAQAEPVLPPPPPPPEVPVVTQPVVTDVTLTGTDAANALTGGGGADTLAGLGETTPGLGDDLLVGGRGRDILLGGDGADRFDFNAVAETVAGGARDAVKDFQTGLDRIDLKGMDANGDKSGNQTFSWADKRDLDAAFTGREGELRFAGGILSGDTDGDGKANFEIAITGRLAAGDVIL